jgi:hypothetical protein
MNAPIVIAAATIVVAIVLGVFALSRRMKQLDARLTGFAPRQDRDRQPKEKDKRDELAQLKQEMKSGFDALRASIGDIAATARRIESAQQAARDVPARAIRSMAPPPDYDAYETPRSAEDSVAVLLQIANRTLQQNPMRLDEFRASAASFAGRISAYAPSGEGVPYAFLVEHRGTLLAVPNTGKPGRLPSDWFNRSDFGFNDEIHRVVSLPRLRERGNDYEVQEPGVFAK